MVLAAADSGTDTSPARMCLQQGFSAGEEKYLEKPIEELRATFDVWVRISSQL